MAMDSSLTIIIRDFSGERQREFGGEGKRLRRAKVGMRGRTF